MQAEIISSGTELLLGQIINTNARFLSETLANLGINVYYQTTVGDNRERFIEALRIAGNRADLIITTGGLGPTGDDLTKEGLALFLGLPLEIVPEELERLQNYFKKRELEWIESNAKQAAIIKGASFLPNERGTAPGIALKHNNISYLLLPGPPREMEFMFNTYGIPWLNKNYLPPEHTKIYSYVLKYLGITESKLEESLQDLFITQTNPTLALTAKTGEIHLRLTTRARNEEEFFDKIGPVMNEIEKRTGKYILARNDETVSLGLGKLFLMKGQTLSTAESCTGGMLSAQLTAVPGSSQYFLGSIVAYSNEVKTNVLGVPRDLIDRHGAVSSEVAASMALNIRKKTGSSIGISITGIAGPDGGTSDKPVGLVYIALNTALKNFSKGYNFTGDRESIRVRSIISAQNILRKYLSDK